MTPLDRFIRNILILVPQGSLIDRYRFGVGMLSRQAKRLKARTKAHKLPTKGFRKDLSANGQDGEMYRHLYFHLAFYLLGPPGWLGSWAIGMIDILQAKKGRTESQTEVRDNIAGRECGRILQAYSKKKLPRAEAEERLRALLAES